MVCEKHTVAVFFFYLWSLIIFPNYVENVNFATLVRDKMPHLKAIIIILNKVTCT